MVVTASVVVATVATTAGGGGAGGGAAELAVVTRATLVLVVAAAVVTDVAGGDVATAPRSSVDVGSVGIVLSGRLVTDRFADSPSTLSHAAPSTANATTPMTTLRARTAPLPTPRTTPVRNVWTLSVAATTSRRRPALGDADVDAAVTQASPASSQVVRQNG